MSVVEDFVYDPFSPEAMRDPLPFYEVLREHYPVYYAEKYDLFFVSRFQDIWDFLSLTDNSFLSTEGSVVARDPLLTHNDGPVPDPPKEPFQHGPFGSPLYEEVRQAHGRPLRPGAVRQLEGFIRDVARERLDVLLPQGRFDLTQEYGGIVSASVICHLLRLPLSMAKEALDSVNAATRTDPDGGGFDISKTRELCNLIVPTIAARREEGTDGSFPMVDGLLEFRIDGRLLTDFEVAMNLLCVFIGGTETLPKVMAHGLLELSKHPDQLAEVRADLAANCAVASEEIIRFCGPAQWFMRTARKEVTIAGQTIRPGQRVAWLTQSGGRDPREFEDPDELRWDRPIKRTVAFGLGQHFCIGVHVARLEARILLEEFLARVADYEVDVDAAVRLPSSFQWGYNVMPVVIRQLA